jgi:PAS domain S-box-containing protein
MTRVLIVEDSQTQAEELRFILESEGLEVETAIDGKAGLAKVLEARFDLVVSDVVMPGLGGYDLCRAIKAERRLRDTPVILLTSLSDPMDIIKGLECGADNFFTKPYDGPVLLKRIRGILDNRRLRSGGMVKVGIEIFFLGRKFLINSDREQILDLLIGTFEDTVRANQQLRAREADLAAANAKIEQYVQHLQERVRTSEEYFRTLVESMDDAVFSLDLEQRFTGVFGGWMLRQATVSGAFQGKTPRQVFGPESAIAHEAAAARALAGDRANYEWTFGGPGEVRHFHSSLSPLRGPTGRVTGLVGVSHEVTEQKLLQAQLMVSDRMASVGMLAAGVAHEINNPLSSVVANLELVVREVDECMARGHALAEMRAELKDATDGAERVSGIVRDLKIFSRTEDPEELGPVSAEAVMESSLRMAWNEIRHRARLVRRFTAVPMVQANESRLGQVFLNLVVNAAQALPDGQAERHEIRVGTAVDAAGRVVVQVGDTGPGIPPEIRRHLFSPFFTTKPAGVGTGLGLAICQRLVTGFGGEITVVTGEQGTTFSIALPRATGLPVAPTAPAPSTPAVRRGRVLVVDDEPMITTTVRRILSRHHDVTTANGGREALALLAQSPGYDVILCDLMMPEMTGMELYAELRRTMPQEADRTVFLSGGAFTPAARAFLDRTPAARVEKPFNVAQLCSLVNSRVR